MRQIITLIPILLCFGSLQAQQITDDLLKAVAEARKVDCDSAVNMLPKEKVAALPTSTTKAQAALELGYAHYCLGNFEDALQNYQLAFDLFDTLEDKSKPSEVLNLMGILQSKQGNLELAEEYYRSGLDFALETNDSLGIGNSLNNLGNLQFKMENTLEALHFFRKSTAVKAAIDDTIGLSYNYDNLGMTFSVLEQFDSSRYYFDLAADYKLLIGEKVGYAIVKNNIGEMLLQQGKADEAKPYFKEALVIAREVAYADFENHVLNMLAQVAEAQGAYKTALDFFKDHVQLKDSLFNERRAAQVTEIETKYQTEKKEQTIALQEAQLKQSRILLIASFVTLAFLIIIGFLWRNRTKKKELLLLQEAQIQAREAEIQATISSQEKERSRYARDLHDGFGQMISILNMNLKNLQNGAKPSERQKVFEESSKVIDEMYGELKNICFDLMPQTLIQNGVSAALSEFIERVNTGGKVFIELNVFGLENRLTELQEISLYRISQEWVNNILKYSDAHNLTLQITKDDIEITLLIEDDGNGFNRELLTSGKGSGWKNLNTRTKLIQGELELETSEGVRGSTLIVNAPAQPASIETAAAQNTMKAV